MPTDAGGNRTVAVSGEVASDVVARNESPTRRISVAPESASRTSSALRVTGAGIALVSGGEGGGGGGGGGRRGEGGGGGGGGRGYSGGGVGGG